MKQVFVVFFALLAAPALAQHGPHADLVAKAQQDLRAAGIDITGDCGAFKVTNLAVVYIRATGDTQAGVLSKSAGSGCTAYGGQLFAKDAIVYPNGEVYDTIIASGAMGGNGGPTWNKSDNRSDVVCPCPPGLWRSPVDPALYGFGAAPTPVPTPGPVPAPAPVPAPIQSVDLGAVYSRLDGLYAQAERIYADLAARDTQIGVQVQAVDAHLTEIDNNPSWLKKVLTNPFVVTTMTAVGAILTGRYVVPAK
jgi:hypothetical protein